LSDACAFALRTFKEHPGLTRDRLAEKIGYKAADRACKRAYDLFIGLYKKTGDERLRGLIDRFYAGLYWRLLDFDQYSSVQKNSHGKTNPV
jgi:hypothetical protein